MPWTVLVFFPQIKIHSFILSKKHLKQSVSYTFASPPLSGLFIFSGKSSCCNDTFAIYIAANKEYLKKRGIILKMRRFNSYIVWNVHSCRLIFLRITQNNQGGCFFETQYTFFHSKKTTILWWDPSITGTSNAGGVFNQYLALSQKRYNMGP